MHRQPPIEATEGAPLQLRCEGGDLVVGIRTVEGWRELKRIRE
jgi:hypothetical protein